MENTRIASWECKGIWSWEEALATFEVFETHSFDIVRKERKLTESVIGMAMEGPYKWLIAELMGTLAKGAIVDCSAEFAANIVAQPKP